MGTDTGLAKTERSALMPWSDCSISAVDLRSGEKTTRKRFNVSTIRIVHSIIYAVILSVAAVYSVPAQTTVTEAEIKAVLLYKISRFVHWPGSAFPDSTSPFVLCMFGDDTFGAALDFLDSESVHDRPILVMRLTDRSAEFDTCHAMFINARGRELRSILSQLRDKPILTFGDTIDFPEDGGAVGLFTEGDRVHFAVNPAIARQAGLQISAQVLQLARIVENKNGGQE
ncbi:MAG: YfiR family protein [Gammaproteobacteria bacterium]|nr:YfiR family protein [Gammaproteobacteria bacterium]MDH3508129.1 YfiR family protein [Gammaproteobacteria bacterium]